MTRRSRQLALHISLLLLLVSLAYSLGGIASRNETVKIVVSEFGYPGIVLLSIVSGFNVLVPVPVISFLPLFLESGLAFWFTIISIAMGLTMGDLLGYLIGLTGRKIFTLQERQQQTVRYLEELTEKYRYAPMILLFLFASFVPFPNETLVIPLAFLGFKLRHLLPVLIVGHLIFNTLAGLTASALFYTF